MSDITDEEIRRANDLVRQAIALERERGRLILLAITHAYDRALEDSKTSIPSYLHAVLEVARKESA